MGSELLVVNGLLMPLNNPLRQVLLLSLLCRGHTAGQGGGVTCPRWHSWNLAPGFDPSSSGERKEARVPVAATACPRLLKAALLCPSYLDPCVLLETVHDLLQF